MTDEVIKKDVTNSEKFSGEIINADSAHLCTSLHHLLSQVIIHNLRQDLSGRWETSDNGVHILILGVQNNLLPSRTMVK